MFISVDFFKSIPDIGRDSIVPEIISVFVSILFLGFSVTLRRSAEIKIRVGNVPGTFLLYLTFIKSLPLVILLLVGVQESLHQLLCRLAGEPF